MFPATEQRKHLGVLIKPASSVCNLNCTYCFYLEKDALYPWKDRPRLSLETFRTFVEQFAAVNGPNMSFAWQGGEPTVMGLDFFRHAVDEQISAAKASGPGPIWHVSNALQTNGTLLDDEWAAFLHEYDWLVGVSCDGPPEWHDHYRVDRGGRETHQRVLRGIGHLRDRKVEFNVLTVVNHVNVQRPRELFHYLVEQGFDNLQFIPLAEPLPGHSSIQDGGPSPFSITPEEYGKFLNETFDAWLAYGYERIRIRFFDNVLQMLLGLSPNVCQLAASCGDYVVLEHNGDVYPCDFFVENEWKLGNILEEPLSELVASERFRAFARQKRKLHSDCLVCRWRPLCHGECPRYRITNAGSADSTLPYFCSSYKDFYGQSFERIQAVAAEARRLRAPDLPEPSLVHADRRARESVLELEAQFAGDSVVPALKSMGRNDPCPCGSGKKYKQCCGR